MRVWHNHTSDQARKRCREANRKRNTRRIEHYRRCPDCEHISTGEQIRHAAQVSRSRRYRNSVAYPRMAAA